MLMENDVSADRLRPSIGTAKAGDPDFGTHPSAAFIFLNAKPRPTVCKVHAVMTETRQATGMLC